MKPFAGKCGDFTRMLQGSPPIARLMSLLHLGRTRNVISGTRFLLRYLLCAFAGIVSSFSPRILGGRIHSYLGLLVRMQFS